MTRRAGHGTASLLTVLLGAALLALLAPLAGAASETFAVEAYGPNEGYHFEFNGNSTPNPTVNVTAGSHVTITFSVSEAATAAHNIHVDAPVDAKVPCCKSAGQNATLQFDVPANATGSITYWCDLHRSLGMEGTFRVQSASTPGTAGTGSGSGTYGGTGNAPARAPGFDAVLGLAALAGAVLAARRR